MARPPKATAELKLHGNYRPDRHGDRSDESMAIGDPIKPDDLDATASWLWDTIVDGMLPTAKAQVDTPLLTGMCRWWSIWRDLDGQYAAKEGNPYQLLQMAVMAWKQFEKCASRFGMSTADRAKLKIPPSEKTGDDFDDFLSKHA